MRLFPKYSWIEWSLLSAMGVTVVIVPMTLPESLASMRFLVVFVLFISLAMNAYSWQDQFLLKERYDIWLGVLIAGPIISLMSYYAHGLYAITLTGIVCANCAPWSMLRVFLRRRFLGR